MANELKEIENDINMSRQEMHFCADMYKEISDDIFSALNAEDKFLLVSTYQKLYHFAEEKLYPSITSRIDTMQRFVRHCNDDYKEVLLKELTGKIITLQKLRSDYKRQCIDIKMLINERFHNLID